MTIQQLIAKLDELTGTSHSYRESDESYHIYTIGPFEQFEFSIFKETLRNMTITDFKAKILLDLMVLALP